MSRTFICTDLHGQYNLWEQIKNQLYLDDTLYCLGDCIDRGDRGLQILQEMMADPRVILLKGNHEDMMIHSMNVWFFDKEHSERYMSNWVDCNGGFSTFYDLLEYPENEIKSFLAKVKDLPERAEYTNPACQHIIMTHSGWDGNLQNYVAINGSKLNPYLWDRDHIYDYPDYVDPDISSNTYIIHGHTPVPIPQIFTYYWREHDVNDPAEWKPIHYAYGHKIDIDLGSFFTHRAVLFNADTLEEVMLYDTTIDTKSE